MLSSANQRRILYVTVMFAVAGLAFGLLPTLYGGQGDTPIQVGEQADTPTPSAEQQQQQQNQFKNQVVRFVVTFGPYFPVLMGAIVGLIAGVSFSGSRQDVLVSVAAGAFVGTILFLLLSGLLAVQQAAVSENSFQFSEPVSLKFGTQLLNGVFVGIPAAIGAAGGAYAGDELGE
jgi:hypothetical protein